MNTPLRVGVIAGEESGDILAADLVRALRSATGREVVLVGVGGRHLEGEGLQSLFPAHEIALMGITAILRDLPRLVGRIGSTARALAAANLDCLVTVDNPDFTLRVAAKVRALAPSLPIIHYVCPSVWAWRPERAPRMARSIDRILCILPFEPEALERLKGPPGTFVGHRLAADPAVDIALDQQLARAARPAGERKTLLMLPGSRRYEVTRLSEPFGQALAMLRERLPDLDVILPTVPHVAATVRDLTKTWPVQPRIVEGTAEKWQAFGQADAALAASGTVSLELALAGVPTVLAYRTDALMSIAQRLITIWSAALPNLIADTPVVPEYFDLYVRPGMLARQLERLMSDGPAREAQLQGFAAIRRRMATERPSGEVAAHAVLQTIAARRGAASG